jgi:hypothetical protein
MMNAIERELVVSEPSAAPSGSVAASPSTSTHSRVSQDQTPPVARPLNRNRPGISVTEHLDAARGPHPEAFEDLDRRRLARAVRPQQAEHLTAVRGERDVVQHVVRPVAHPQFFDAQDCFALIPHRNHPPSHLCDRM